MGNPRRAGHGPFGAGRGRRASVVFVLITMFIDVLGMGLVIPILPKLVQNLLGGAVAEASFIFGLLVSIYAVMQFLCAPVLGALSDRFGRRPVILLALVGLGFDYVLLSLAPSIWWLVLGRIVAGVFGATFTPAGAYIADVSPPEKRAANFGLMGVAFGLGFIAGPVLGVLTSAAPASGSFVDSSSVDKERAKRCGRQRYGTSRRCPRGRSVVVERRGCSCWARTSSQCSRTASTCLHARTSLASPDSTSASAFRSKSRQSQLDNVTT